MSEEYFEDYIRILISKRINENSRYSIRAFARSINEDSSMLSKIVRKKYKLNERIITTIGKKIGLSKEQIECFIKLNKERSSHTTYSELSDRQLSEVFNWQAAVFLRSLDLLKPMEKKELSRQLSLTEDELEILIEKLEKLNLIKSEKLEKSNKYVRTEKQFLLKRNVNNQHKKRLAKEFISLSLNSVEKNEESERTHVSQVFSMNHNTYELLRNKVHDFMLDISKIAQSDVGSEDQVMLVNLNLVPMIKN